MGTHPKRTRLPASYQKMAKEVEFRGAIVVGGILKKEDYQIGSN